MGESRGRLVIGILFPIIITLFTMLIYMVLLVVFNEKSIDLGLFSIILIVITGLIRVVWIFIPLDFKNNTITKRIFSGYVNGISFLNSVVNQITILLVFIGVIIGFINYLL